MGERLLEVAMLVARETREEVKALFGAGGGDVEEARGLGVLEVGGVLDAGRAAEREPDAFDAVAQGAAAAVGDRGGEDAREALEEEVVLDQLPDGRVAAGAGNVVELLK